MNKYQKQQTKKMLENEKEVIDKLKQNYAEALSNVKRRIKELMSQEQTQSKIYRLQYQQALEKQLEAILTLLASDNINSINEYLEKTYEDGFIGTLFNMQKEGVPFIMPINQNGVIKSITKTTADFQLSKTLYKNADDLKRVLQAEITRGISQNSTYSKIAQNISNHSEADFNKAYRIARTEGGRVESEAKFECMQRAKSNGADVVKEWDSSIDSRTRKSHAELDGQIRELDEPFEINGHKAMYPHNFGIASEDINCRCSVLERARWAIEDDMKYGFTKNIDGNIVRFENIEKYEEFKKKYFEFYDNHDKILSLAECKKLIQEHNIIFVDEDLKILDSKLLSDNVNQLDKLLNKYSMMEDYIENKKMMLGAENFANNSMVAAFNSSIDHKKLSIQLSKSKYREYEKFINVEKNDILSFHSMPCSDDMLSVYSITHEFGHFIESKFINEYNQEHLAEFLNMKTRAINAKTISQSKKILKDWEKKIGNGIAEDILKIAKEDMNFKLKDNLSDYGDTDSLEFFAECFANMECGKPNDLGRAMEKYLKNKGVL